MADVYEIAREPMESALNRYMVHMGPICDHHPDECPKDCEGQLAWAASRELDEIRRALLAQKAVVEAAVEQERQRFLADEARAARQDLETQAQHTEDYRSACRTTNAAVRAMKEQTR